MNDVQGTPLTKKAASKHISRHNMWWYPKRCEVEGCNAGTDGLKRCAACCMVLYCSPEHQKQDWPLHKIECRVFQRLQIRAFFYTDEEMFQKFPMTPPTMPNKKGKRKREPASSCPLCGKSADEVELTITDCCGQPVCDTELDYEVFSYSREYCPRSHRRYTLCGNHGSECDNDKDWRECPKCSEPRDHVQDWLWRGLNPYNLCPLPASKVPRHSLCDTCGGCGRKFISGLEGHTVRRSRGKSQIKCLDCDG